jgi:hypothetical protein
MRPKVRTALWATGVAVALLAGIGIGGASGSSDTAAPAAKPAPTVTKTQYVATPGPTITKTRTIHVKPPGPKGQIAGDGVFVVGTDIPPGVYHTTGAVGGTAGNCYVALLSSTNTEDIIDNNNVTGPDTITVGSGVHAVESEGCNTWHRIG